ncbi:cold-responsive protein kinase 1-like isoform X1 [Zingiber officinale]|uniref:cold-responsive protein kinase 1-like isoform X1 n=1 Tax=Zingiber officinale TaxID=94328 RepID=UPI001C4C5C5E|nr:cold-responsive protein kinase 1-like isoform X1 [Zingiber officinale]
MSVSNRNADRRRYPPVDPPSSSTIVRHKKFFSRLMKSIFRGRNKEAKEEEDLEKIAAKEEKAFRYEKLVAATHNFSPKQKLGEGGFGPVFKTQGRLEDGREVAVKQLGKGSRQGAREFQNEALLLSRVQHKNVVNLYGYCVHGDDMLLVYEYVPNESLDRLLFSRGQEEDQWRRKSTELDWNRRFQVMVGVARGILYLHDSAHISIIHRDIKASNILLDDGWTPKIADFGMARLFPEEETYVKTRVAGTNGYMAPEYVMRGQLSTKADVFSFGVLVLELISGRKSNSFIFPDPDAGSLLEWAWKLYNQGRSVELMDPVLKPTADEEQVALCVEVGLLCTQSDPKLRPDMKRVVIVLSKKRTALEEPMMPGVPGSLHARRYHVTPGGSRISAGKSSFVSASTCSTASSSTATSASASTTPSTSASTAPSTSTAASTSRTRHASQQEQRPLRRH